MRVFNLFKNNPSSSDDETLNYISKSLQNEEYEDFNANNNNEESLSKAFDKAKLVQKEVQVRGKNGQIHTRKQWVKAGEDPKADKPVKAQEEQKDSKSKKTEKNTQKTTKEEIANMTLQNYDYQKLKSYILSLPDAKTFAKDYRQIINKDVDKKYMEDKQKEEAENKFVTVSFDAPKDGNSKKAIATMIAGGHSRDEIMSEAQKQGIEWKYSDHPAINWMRASVAIQKHMSGSASSNSDNTPTTESQTQQETNSNLSEATDSGLSKEVSPEKSVIGSDYTQLTTEEESGTPEGEAHNMIVGRLKSMGIKKPTKLDVQQAANDLRDRSIETIISSYNSETISTHLALANAFGNISNAGKLTVERVLKDTLERGSGATREQQCDAISKLCGDGSEYDYESFGDNVAVRASDGDGKSIAVNIEPTVKGLFKVEFVYGNGDRSKETYDSIDSVKKATENWIKKQENYSDNS